MAKVIGPAVEFFRLRLIHIDQGGDSEFEWRDDVLWRDEPVSFAAESDAWVLQAITLDEAEAVLPIASFGERDEALAALEEATADLEAMTRTEFEGEYLHESASDSGGAASAADD